MMRGSGSGHRSDRSSLRVRSRDSVPFPVQRVWQFRLLGNDTRARLALG